MWNRETPSLCGGNVDRADERVRTEERERIGRELHDGVCQELVGATCALEVLRRKLTERGVPEAAGVATVASLVDRALREARALAHGREGLELGVAGLPAALARLAEETERVYGVTCGFAAVGDEVPMSAAAAGHMYRIAQEAVGNAVRHGRARYVTVALSTTDGVVRMTVDDDGVGFRNATEPGAGMGLRTMAYRARAIGGALEVKAGKMCGTVVGCTVPVGGLEPAAAGR